MAKKPPPTHMLREESEFGTHTFHGTFQEMFQQGESLREADEKYVRHFPDRRPVRLLLGTVHWEAF